MRDLTAWAITLGLLAAAVPALAQDAPKQPPAEKSAAETETPGAPADESGTPPKSDAKSDAKAAAAADPDVATIPTVIVSEKAQGKRVYRTPLRWAGSRTVITPDDVRTAGVQSAQDLLRLVPGIVTYDESGSDSKPNIGLRGSPAERAGDVSLLADGIPLAPAPYGHNGQSLFPFASERIYAIDVIRGGYTVRYGPNTVAGVINFLTRPIPKRETWEQSFRLNEFGDFSSYTGLGGQYDRLGVLLESVEKVGQTFRRNGDYRIYNTSLKAAYDFTAHLRLLFQLEYFKDESRLADGMSPAQYDADPHESQAEHNFFFGEQIRTNFALEWHVATDHTLKLLGYAFGGERGFALANPRQADETPNRIDFTPRPMTVAAIEAQYVGGWNLADGVRDEIGFGVRYHREKMHFENYRVPYPAGATPTITWVQNASWIYDAFSMYLDNTLKAGEFTLVLGARLEDLQVQGFNRLTGQENREGFFHLLPAFSASYLLTPNWSVYTNAQNAFQPPQSAELDLGGNAGAQDLHAETAWTFEGGTRGRFFDGLLSPDVCAFFTWYEDKIESNPFNLNLKENVGESRESGLEVRLDSELGPLHPALEGLRVFGCLTLMETEIMEGANRGNQLPQIPRRLASWGVEYKHACGGYAKIDGVYTGWSYADAANTRQENPQGLVGKQPSSTVWNARLGYQAVLAAAPEMEFGVEVGVNNVFDAEYYWRRSGKGIFPGAPRAFYGAVRLIIRY